MSETPIVDDPNTQDVLNEPFKGIDTDDDALFLARAAQSERARVPQVPQAEVSKPRKELRTTRFGKTVTAATIVGSAAFGITSLAEGINGPEFSDQNKSYTFKDGEGLFHAVDSIPGSEKYDRRDIADHIKSDPANISVLEDGIQLGDTISIPTEIK